jgi:two-component system CheB/CheR fusion protein
VGSAQQTVRGASEEYLTQLPVGLVVVDRKYDIRAINTVARQLLSIHGVAIGEDFLHAMQEETPYAEVRAAIDTAFRDGESFSSGEFALEDAPTGEVRYLRLDCYPRRAEGEARLAQTVMIVVHDVTQEARERRRLEERVEALSAEVEAFRREAEAEAARLGLHNERLVETNRRLEEANRELIALNEQLQKAYEGSLVSTEEAQAAYEEVETLNEELQATNEELETLNEELQATIEELNTTNEDLQSRSAELEEMAREREEERQESEAEWRHLQAALEGIGAPVLTVDERGKALLSNELFRVAFGDWGGEPSEEDASSLLGGCVVLEESGERMASRETPQARAARGESFEIRFAVDGQDGARPHWEARGRPSGGEDAGGGVIVFRQVAET